MPGLFWLRSKLTALKSSPLFTKYLILTNTAANGTLMALGDVTVQQFERRNNDSDYNYGRTGRMMLVGLFLGPFNHAWYKILDRFLPLTNGVTVCKKILLDQSCAAPFFITTFFLGMGTVEGRKLTESSAELKQKFWLVYRVDWCFWPAAQAFNFYFLPTQVIRQ